MKKGIHPEYKPATIVCSCGNRIETRSTQEEIHVEICSVCHPFYTGRQKLVDTAGRVERFKRKYGDVTGGSEQEDEEESAEAEAPEGASADAGEPAEADGDSAESVEEPTSRPVGASAPAELGDAAVEEDEEA